MKKILFVTLVSVFVLVSAGAEDLLFFCGGRLYGSGRMNRLLESGGCTTKFVDTRDLAGFGGSILKYEDKEPEKKDGITPEFKRLNKYRAIFFCQLKITEMADIFTPERVNALTEYVKNGGTFFADINTPAALNALLPVTFKGNPRKASGIFVGRNTVGELKELPDKWQKFSPYRLAVPKKDAVVHAELFNAQGGRVAPFIVTMKYGKGKVVFCNGAWSNSSAPVSFTSWGYSQYFVRGLLSFVLERPLKNDLKKVDWPVALSPLGKTDYPLAEFHAGVQKGGKLALKGNTAMLENGIKIKVLSDGGVEIFYPGVKTAFKWNAPVFKTSGNPQSLNGDNNEAIVQKYDLKEYKVEWKKIGFSVKDGLFAVNYSAPGIELAWEFIPVKMDLDGRNYIGYADRVNVKKLPIFLESVVFEALLPNGKIRRNTCYTSPRGYLETVLSPEPGKISDSKTWQFFCSGQPFTYLYLPQNGIFAEMVDYPIPCYVQFKAESSGQLFHSVRLLAGRRKTPAVLPWLLHFYSAGKEQGNNDYIALYQFARRYLRERCGIKTFPQVTQASYYLHGRKTADLDRSAKAAAELNFRSVWLTLCPLQMVEIGGKKLAEVMQSAKKQGLLTHPWTAGGYNHKDSCPLFKDHPDWFIRRKDGSFHRYFKILGVADFNNPHFRKWFLNQILAARKNGLDRVYHDMGGEISNQVNHYPPKAASTATLDGLIELLKEYSKLNIPCSVEGMNPLVKDQALFNPDKAYPLKGKEFAYVGGTPLATVDNGQANALHCDYFRMLMYNATINIDVDGYRNKFERIPGELEAMKHIKEWNLLFNKAHEFVEAPFVRETPFGTAWIGKTSAALFFERGVKELKLHLPPLWQIQGNAPLKNIPAHSVLFLEKK